MFNRSNSGGGPRRTYFLVGVLTGAAAVGAYTISCDATSPATSGTGATPGTTATPAANEVPYANAQSGLSATTVQAAIDEIGTTMRTATAGAAVVTGGGATPTTWTIEMKVLDTTVEAFNTTNPGTVTVTETAPGQGSYETSGTNVFIFDGFSGPPMGTRTGKYFVVGDHILIIGERAPGQKTIYDWPARLTDAGHTLTLVSGQVVLVLTKQ